MTGNTKIWRAPLAGLASVAMLATMGVATATANASAPDANTMVHESDYEVTVGTGAAVDTYKNETYAEAAARAGSGTVPTLDYGTYTVDGEAFDPFRTPITADTKVDFTAPTGNTVTVKFAGNTTDPDVNISNIANQVVLPFGTSFQVPVNTELGSLAVPMDKTSNKNIIITKWNVHYDSPDIQDKQVTTEELANVDVMNGGNVTITPAETVEAYKVTFDYNGLNANGHVLGSYLDGTPDASLTVDVAKNGSDAVSVTAPADVVSNESTSYKKLSGWKLYNQTTEVGKSVSVTYGATFTAVSDSEWVRVYFVDPQASNKILQVVEVTKGGYVKAADVKDPTKTGYTFDGWYTDSSLSDKVKLTSAGYDFTGYKLDSSAVFYAKFVSSDTINVTFSAGDYDGAGEEKTVKYSPDAFVQESDAPEYTRAGYVLSGWTLNNNPYNFDKQNAGEANGGKDFKLVAKWTIVTADVAKAALQYINPDRTIAVDVDGDGTDENLEMGSYFTSASWTEYKTAYKAASQKYDSAAYKGDITPVISAEIVSDLKAAWEKLVFKHTSGADVLADVTVHRLSKGSDHFYTQDTNELLYMTAVQGWTDEGRLFDASNRAGASYFASFSNVTRENGSKFSDEVLSELADAADEIVEPVYRAYNKVTGDHVWTVDANEYAHLEAQSAWNVEEAAFYTPKFTGTTDVTRLYKDNAHLLSTDSNEVKVLSTKMGWTDEGTAFKAY